MEENNEEGWSRRIKEVVVVEVRGEVVKKGAGERLSKRFALKRIGPISTFYFPTPQRIIFGPLCAQNILFPT